MCCWPAGGRETSPREGMQTIAIIRGRQAQTTAGQPASLDTSRATPTRRAADGAKIIPTRSSDWAFADCSKTSFLGTPDPDNRVPGMWPGLLSACATSFTEQSCGWLLIQ